ncbi:NAD-dependent epimerase/dehydratase family protein [Herbiconiux ginsengi]|uniref:UDP-glucose 4-epimerase n=1 Tax=Herbiconiux ginsengi TaxID=381665 RepID=A0A1H3STB6_9MICO|nr:NAD-dependent epimerase/dehydratase family protein [Herbiconiux ginsengi]SDZ41202.1 UDP-glucose 4-epimerase [Herbiconiux ginsengi]
MHVLITGGAGFIGSNLARFLTATGGDRVTVFDDFSVGDIRNFDGLDVDVVSGSVLDQGAVTAAIADVDAVVHLAALNSVAQSMDAPHRFHDTNVTGTLNVLEAARQNGGLHTVVASSSSVYGRDPSALTLAPISPYAVGKLAVENYATTWSEAFGLPVLTLRFFNVFGPRQRQHGMYPAVVPSFVDAALDGRTIEVFGSGRQTRDFVYVDTVCSVIAGALAGRVATPRPIDVGNGRSTSLLELVAVLQDVVGRPLEVRHLAERPGDVAESLAQVAALDALFPDRLTFSLEDAVRTTIEWKLADR